MRGKCVVALLKFPSLTGNNCKLGERAFPCFVHLEYLIWLMFTFFPLSVGKLYTVRSERWVGFTRFTQGYITVHNI